MMFAFVLKAVICRAFMGEPFVFFVSPEPFRGWHESILKIGIAT
jgi:hypothetical protein